MKTSEKGVMRNALRVMITRELWALDREIAAYPDDESPWKLVPGISNSAGNLVLHVAGNLRHFTGSRTSQCISDIISDKSTIIAAS